MNKYGKSVCMRLLCEKFAQTAPAYPKRSDFTSEEVVAIKAHLGPWPRALEAAGIKPARSTDRLELNRQKRARAKKRRYGKE